MIVMWKYLAHSYEVILVFARTGLNTSVIISDNADYRI
jgi:hypothetical protein